MDTLSSEKTFNYSEKINKSRTLTTKPYEFGWLTVIELKETVKMTGDRSINMTYSRTRNITFINTLKEPPSSLNSVLGTRTRWMLLFLSYCECFVMLLLRWQFLIKDIMVDVHNNLSLTLPSPRRVFQRWLLHQPELDLEFLITFPEGFRSPLYVFVSPVYLYLRL